MDRDSNYVHPHEERQADMLRQQNGQISPAPNGLERQPEKQVGSREEYPVTPESSRVRKRVVRVARPPNRREKQKKRPWYNQGWLWLIVAAIGIAVFSFAVSGLTQQAGQIKDTLQEQTGIFRMQNEILTGIREGIDGMTRTINHEFDRLIQAIREAIQRFGSD